MIRTWWPAVALAAVALVTSSVRADSPTESWYVSTLGGARVGHSREIVSASREGDVVTTVESRMSVRREGQTVAIEVTERWVESPDGAPIAYRSARTMGPETIVLELDVADGELHLRKTLGATEDARVLESESPLLFPWAAKELRVSRGFGAGTQYSYAAFDGEFEAVGHVSVTVAGDEALTIKGEERVLHKLALDFDLLGGIEILEWRDDEGRLWREELPALGLVRERATRDEALASGAIGDVVVSTKVASNAALGDPSRIDSALYELWLTNGDIVGSVPEDARQRVVGRTDRGVLVRVERTVPEPGAAGEPTSDPAAFSEYLSGSTIMQTEDGALIEAAEEAVSDGSAGAWEAARSIERWVFRTIVSKNLATTFASARAVLETRSGDCSEHAVLMATLARIAGIPSRVASGIVYGRGGFAYHMWVEIWTGSAWHALDPTLGKGSVDATHVKFADSALSHGSVGELSVGILKVVNRLRLKVVEYTVDGKTYRPDDR